ncbi:MAG: DUF2892 domain-containing protein [Candidatus Thiothrix sulfatifontis]|uniref:DUF2892 domain-containing protein n=1 Tax=Thiothrix subterranea TaxID=2735563 RepID=A0AA51MKN3_9GAMM|nr:DUF2892 domain-containing protein [Thiothrix subterranea]MDQ5767647.1 DUF2892 domain-containing protein [Thiothrix subterranea]UOG90857.1 MAG: DUF2892 domain-containing protein [Candidatus Thiothrix sulfatifontis]WML85454.1 DUF2892 domain-containing protein [Thiothrix subterranea]
MEKNVGSMDRNIRFGAGAVLLIWGLVFKGGFLLILLGIALLATGYLNFCPAYKLIGMNTNKS